MARKATRQPEPSEGDLFAYAELYPVRAPVEVLQPIDLSLRIKTAMGRALKECPDPASIVAARMTELTGRTITVDALYAYTAASKPDHDMGLIRFVAFVRATGATWLWSVLVEDDGLLVMEGREARLAQLGLMSQEHERLGDALRQLRRELRTSPVKVATCRRSSPSVNGRPPFGAGGKP